jgi:hypothetical protein
MWQLNKTKGNFKVTIIQIEIDVSWHLLFALTLAIWTERECGAMFLSTETKD